MMAGNSRGPDRWRPIRLVAARELREGLRNRMFQVTFLLTLLVVLGAIVVPTLMSDDDGTTLGLTDPAALDADELVAAGEVYDLELAVVEVEHVEAGERQLREGELDALLVGTDELVAERNVDATLRALVTEVVSQDQVLAQLTDSGVEPETAAAALAAADGVEIRALEEPDDPTAVLFAVAGTALLLMGVTFFASSVLTGVIEEKASRVVEVVLGAVRPWQLLTGKLLGIGSLALAQVLLLVGGSYLAVVVTGAAELPDTGPRTLAAVVSWFLLGFALYSVVYAAAGSLVNRSEDAQASAAPIGFLLFAAYFGTFVVVFPDPDGTAARIVSQIPGVAPLAMPARVALEGVTAAEMALAVVTTLLTTVLAVRVAGIVYARSILATQRVTWRQALRRPAGR